MLLAISKQGLGDLYFATATLEKCSIDTPYGAVQVTIQVISFLEYST